MRHALLESNLSLTKCFLKRCSNVFIAAGYNISCDHYKILAQLNEHTEISQKIIVKDSIQSEATITRIVEKLKRLGYIKRLQNPSNRRENLLSITSDGKKVSKELLNIYKKEEEDVLMNVTEEELRKALRIIKKILSRFGEQDIFFRVLTS